MQRNPSDRNAAVASRRLYILRREYLRRTKRPLIVTSFHRSPAQQARAIYNNIRRHGLGSVLSLYHERSGYHYSPAVSEMATVYRTNRSGLHDALSGIFPDLERFIEPTRAITVRLSLPEDADYKKELLFWFSLFGLIVSPISAVSTAVVAWISVHRGRADELLKQMQIEKMELEMELLRIELADARLKATRLQSRIIIAAG